MKNLIRRIDTLNESLGRWISWLALAMVLVMGLIVVLRYAFQIGSIALQESVMYLNALIFTFGAAYTLKQQGHVRVDVFYNRLSPRARGLIDLLGTGIFLTLTAGFIIWASWDYVAVSWRIREGSAESSGLPYVYLLKASLLVLPLLLIIQGIAEAIKSLQQILSTAVTNDASNHPGAE
jgi:TRAP-type mannitol/chloroaromatic compound transport system permease small subunit